MSDKGEQLDFLDILRSKPLSTYSYEERCELKMKRPTPNLNIHEINKKQSRQFQYSWYERFSWLTGSCKTNKMYYYVCILFGDKDLEWCTQGISDLSNFIKKAIKHQSSKAHLLNKEKFQLLGRHRIDHVFSEAARLQAIKHNEQVALNRQVLGRIIQTIIYLCKQELPLRGHREDDGSSNRGNYVELLNLLAQNESVIRDHLQSASTFKGTSAEIQNELIEVITSVVKDKIKSEIQECSFVSIQADETLDVSCKSQLSIIFRYCVQDRIEERFVGFYDVSNDKSGAGLAGIIRMVLEEWHIDKNKVISQTYDGCSVMAGQERGVQNLVKQFCPLAIFIHCYAHQLNLVLLYGSKTIKQVRLFISDLTAFHTFFSKSSKRTALLTEKGFKLPQACTTRWNFHSRAVTTIIKYFNELYLIFNAIVDDENSQWDYDTINRAKGLVKYMDDATFVYLLYVYEACFIHIEPLFKILQSLVNITACHNEIKLAIANIQNLRCETFIEKCVQKSVQLNENVSFSDAQKARLKALTYEIIDCQVVQMNSRFEDFPQLQFLDVVNEKKFAENKKQFPKAKISNLIKQYPGYFNSDQLENELFNIYADEQKYLSPQNLLKYLFVNDLDSVYEEVTKLLQLVATYPATTASSERAMSTLKRVKTYLRNSMTNHRLSNISILAIEKKLLGQLSSDAAFIEKVIDTFATIKNRRMDLVYKTV